jgi:hypothetical protein
MSSSQDDGTILGAMRYNFTDGVQLFGVLLSLHYMKGDSSGGFAPSTEV